MMPAFELPAFVDRTLLYLLDHAVLVGALTVCALALAAKLHTLALEGRFDRDEMNDTHGLTDDKAQHIKDSIRRAEMEQAISFTERTRRDGRAS